MSVRRVWTSFMYPVREFDSCFVVVQKLVRSLDSIKAMFLLLSNIRQKHWVKPTMRLVSTPMRGCVACYFEEGETRVGLEGMCKTIKSNRNALRTVCNNCGPHSGLKKTATCSMCDEGYYVVGALGRAPGVCCSFFQNKSIAERYWTIKSSLLHNYKTSLLITMRDEVIWPSIVAYMKRCLAGSDVALSNHDICWKM